MEVVPVPFSCFQIICMYGRKVRRGSADIKWNNQAQLSLTNSCTNEALRPWLMTRLVESNTSGAAICRRRTEVGRFTVAAPVTTFFVAVGISRDMKTFVEWGITYQELIFVLCWSHSLWCPQTIRVGIFIIVTIECNSWASLGESGFCLGFLIDKHHTGKLQWNEKTIVAMLSFNGLCSYFKLGWLGCLKFDLHIEHTAKAWGCSGNGIFISFAFLQVMFWKACTTILWQKEYFVCKLCLFSPVISIEGPLGLK